MKVRRVKLAKHPKRTCRQKKNLAGRPETTCLSVNDINLRVKSNIATAYPLERAQKKRPKKQNIDKLDEDFVLRERLVDEKGWHHNVCQADEYTLHIYYLCYSD